MVDVFFCSGVSASHDCTEKTTDTLQRISAQYVKSKQKDIPADHSVRGEPCQCCQPIWIGTPYLFRVNIWISNQPCNVDAESRTDRSHGQRACHCACPGASVYYPRRQIGRIITHSTCRHLICPWPARRRARLWKVSARDPMCPGCMVAFRGYGGARLGAGAGTY